MFCIYSLCFVIFKLHTYKFLNITYITCNLLLAWALKVQYVHILVISKKLRRLYDLTYWSQHANQLAVSANSRDR